MPGLLRVATAGSVDDGKSTLIGRLLHDAKAIFDDQLVAVADASRRHGSPEADLALLTDGLRAEREQGITIDVAYRYFSTPRRAFRLADTPGHVQYTRNMVTGASTADVAVVLVDARTGLAEQTRRHAAVAGLLGIRHVVLAVNKIDLAGFAPEVFDEVVLDFAGLARRSGITGWKAVPISALHGDNLVTRSARTPWYDGPALLEHLENLEVPPEAVPGARFAVQLAVRPRTARHRDYRGYAGRVAAGRLRVGDRVRVLPAGQVTTIAGIDTFDGTLPHADAGRSVVVRLSDQLDIGRGTMLAGGAAPAVTSRLAATVCWMSDAPLRPGTRFRLRHATQDTPATVVSVDSAVDVATMDRRVAGELVLNDIGQVTLETADPLVADRYAESRATGGFLLVDETAGSTAGAGMIVEPT